MRTTLTQKIALIKQGTAYVAKSDGAYFFYFNQGTEWVKISRSTYDKLSNIGYGE